jgi:hypothetical protein
MTQLEHEKSRAVRTTEELAQKLTDQTLADQSVVHEYERAGNAQQLNISRVESELRAEKTKTQRLQTQLDVIIEESLNDSQMRNSQLQHQHDTNTSGYRAVRQSQLRKQAHNHTAPVVPVDVYGHETKHLEAQRQFGNSVLLPDRDGNRVNHESKWSDMTGLTPQKPSAASTTYTLPVSSPTTTSTSPPSNVTISSAPNPQFRSPPRSAYYDAVIDNNFKYESSKTNGERAASQLLRDALTLAQDHRHATTLNLREAASIEEHNNHTVDSNAFNATDLEMSNIPAMPSFVASPVAKAARTQLEQQEATSTLPTFSHHGADRNYFPMSDSTLQVSRVPESISRGGSLGFSPLRGLRRNTNIGNAPTSRVLQSRKFF